MPRANRSRHAALDLEALKIDRSRTRRRRRGGAGLRWGIFAVVLVAAGVFFRAPLSRFVDAVRLPRVRVVVAVRSDPAAAAGAIEGTAANGYVVAARRAALSADTPGRIVEMNVEEGSVVKEGDVVARLYSDEYEAALRRAEADLAAAERAVERSRAERAVAASALERLRALVSSAEAQLAEAEADRVLARLEAERARTLVSEAIDSQERLDQARAQLARAEARVEAAEAGVAAARSELATAELQLAVADAALTLAEAQLPVLSSARDLAQATLDKTAVRAPFDGVVVLKDAEVGEVVSPNSLGGNSRGSVVTMVDFDTLEVQVDMPETSLEAVRPGAPTRIFLDAYPGRPYAGRVERIWPTANRQKATVEVRIGFDEPDGLLRPDMGARVVFPPPDAAEPEAPGEARVLVPSECIVRVEGRTGVFVVDRDVALFRELRLGDERSRRFVVLAGLEGGERVVAEPPSSLSDGDRVRVEGSSS